MIVGTRIFEIYTKEYRSLSELAQAMGISISQIYRVREGKRGINQKFIVGGIKAFPGHNLDDLFYLIPKPMIHRNNYHHSTAHLTDEVATKDPA